MSGSRIALVADDQRLASVIQAHLKKSQAQSVLLAKYDTIRDHLSRETNGVLVLLIATGGRLPPGASTRSRNSFAEISLQCTSRRR